MGKKKYSRDVEKLIKDYGKVVEITSVIGTAIPEEFLPASKNEIKNAILLTYSLSDKETRKMLGSLFILLTGFVPMDEALTVFRFNELLTKQGEAIKSGNEIPEINEALEKEWKRVAQNISQEGDAYLKLLRLVDNGKHIQD